MHSGTITKWVPNRGFGFLRSEDGEDYFAHATALPNGWTQAHVGDRYEFDVQTGLDGRARAVNLREVTAAMEEADRVFGG